MVLQILFLQLSKRLLTTVLTIMSSECVENSFKERRFGYNNTLYPRKIRDLKI